MGRKKKLNTSMNFCPYKDCTNHELRTLFTWLY